MMEAADKASKETAVSSKRNWDDNDGGGGPNPKEYQSTPGSSTVWSRMPSSALLAVTLLLLVD